jgi:cytochrome P450
VMADSDRSTSFALKLVGTVLAFSLVKFNLIATNIQQLMLRSILSDTFSITYTSIHSPSFLVLKYGRPRGFHTFGPCGQDGITRTCKSFTINTEVCESHKCKKIMQLRLIDIVRIAPDELSFARADAFNAIYSNAPGRPAFPKSKTWHTNMPGRPLSVFVALDSKVHARFRKAMEPAFTEKSVRMQEPIIQQNVELFISQLSKLASVDPAGAVVDIVQWFAYIAFDLVGDLGFGEPFGSLEASELHPWIGLIFSSIKAATYSVSLSYYPGLSWLFRLAVPKSVMKQMQEHWEFSDDKISRRLEQKQGRADLISMIKRDENGLKGITRPELSATASIIIIAGSETTVSVLSGIVNYMMKSTDVLSKLTHEVRTAFSRESDMSLSALKDMPYLGAVILEGLRLCNPV